MPKYEVSFAIHGSYTEEVEADNEEEAVAVVQLEAKKDLKKNPLFLELGDLESIDEIDDIDGDEEDASDEAVGDGDASEEEVTPLGKPKPSKR